MGSLMDLVAGDSRDIVLALSVDDIAAFDEPERFVAHLPLGGGLDPTWLDLFSEAVRSVTEQDDPVDVPDEQLGALAGRWIGLLEEELGLLPREEKPWIRDLTRQIVDFARRSDHAR